MNRKMKPKKKHLFRDDLPPRRKRKKPKEKYLPFRLRLEEVEGEIPILFLSSGWGIWGIA